MNKLMLAAAIVVAATVSQAATITWSCSKIYAEGTQTGVSGVAYILSGLSQPVGDEGQSIALTKAMIISALEGQGATAVSEWIDGVNASAFTGSSGTFSNTSTSKAVDLSAIGADAGTQPLYIIAFNTAEITDSSKFFVAETSKNLGGSGNTVVAFGAQGNTSLTGASQVAGAWHAVNVPEPTSGLLLVLGMAGLALRRRRA